jgi:hypothetical protein
MLGDLEGFTALGALQQLTQPRFGIKSPDDLHDVILLVVNQLIVSLY